MRISDSSGGKDQAPSGTTKPYLMRAIYEWALDNGLTPHVLISTDNADVIPGRYVKENRFVLNIHPRSVSGLDISNELLWCSARFSGKPLEIAAPISAVLAIYARENGQGIVFQDDGYGNTPPKNTTGAKKNTSKKVSDSKAAKKRQSTSHLKLVK